MNKFNENRIRLNILHLSSFLALILLALGLSGCASTKQAEDPYEKFNRKVYSFNKSLDKAILKPVAKAYVKATPEIMQTGVSNFFDNITYIDVFLNQFLQGNVSLGIKDFGRFMVNSTFGVAGFIDVATPGGLLKHDEDFGQTFAVWGFNSGPYIVAPFFGPMTVQSGLGKVADSFTNPIYYIDDDTTRYSLYGISFVDTRARLLEKESMITGDEYLFVRDAYLQNRAYLIKNGATEKNDPFLDSE
jgi:phospholipid-binding lipoprotein MlaA